MNRSLVSTPSFVRAMKKLVKRKPEVSSVFREVLTFLEADAFDPRLRTHKLKGELADRWACSVGYDLRIVFRFVKSDATEAIVLLSVGTHDEVY